MPRPFQRCTFLVEKHCANLMNAGTDKSIHLLIAHTYDVARIAQLAHTGPEKRLLQTVPVTGYMESAPHRARHRTHPSPSAPLRYSGPLKLRNTDSPAPHTLSSVYSINVFMPTDACIRIHAFTASTLMTQLREAVDHAAVVVKLHRLLFCKRRLTILLQLHSQASSAHGNRNASSDAVISAFPSA